MLKMSYTVGRKSFSDNPYWTRSKYAVDGSPPFTTDQQIDIIYDWLDEVFDSHTVVKHKTVNNKL